MADERIPVAVLGATGSVGQRFVQLLAAHPWFRPAELLASDRSAGKRYREAAEAYHNAVTLDPLTGQEPDQRLGHRQAHPAAHRRPPAPVMGTRGSVGTPVQESRIQPWAGSSQKAIDRSSPGPARTFRYHRS